MKHGKTRIGGFVVRRLAGAGKIALRPGAEKARKAEAKRKLRDPKVWGLQQAKPASPPTLWAPCTKKTGDPNRGPQRR